MTYVPTLTPVIAIHLTCAIAGLALGPVALWARKGAVARPQLHRAFGYAWVTIMLSAAISALFIRDYHFPNIWGYTFIHLFVLLTFKGIAQGFYYLAQGNIAAHRKAMQGTYYGACLGAGAASLLPGRYMGNLVWHQWLGLM
jgi:uncharacterized membrane protein